MKADLKGLTKLADYLAGVPRKQFDMSEWWQESDCGSAGCIAGHAAALFPSRFKKEQEYDFTMNSDRERYTVVHRKSGYDNESAFAEGFHIPVEEAEALIYASNVETPKQAAKAVRALVKRLEKTTSK